MAGIDNNTVLYLRGDSFEDLSLNPIATISNNNATLTSNEGSCMYFDGTSSYVEVENLNFQNLLQNDFTIEFYVYQSSYTQIHPTPLSVANGNEIGFRSVWTHFRNNETSFVYGKGHTSDIYSTTVNALSLKNWHHISMVKDGVYGKVFINGKLINTTTLSSFYTNSNSLYLGILWGTNTQTLFHGYIKNVRVSNIARYTEDFTPPTKAYSSIDINISNKDNNKIDFNILKQGQEVVNKVEVLVNNVVSKTYNNIGDLTYNIDNNLCCIGNNNIIIRVTYDDNYTEEEILTHTVTIDKLPISSSLKDVIDRQELLNNSIEVQKNNLKNILVSKNVEVEEENKLSSLIDKVNELGDVPLPPLYLYNEGDECEDVTGGWEGDTQDKGWDYIHTSVIGTKNPTNLHCVANSTRYKQGFITSKSIDMTKYTKLYIYGTTTGLNSSNYIYASDKIRVEKNGSESVIGNRINENYTNKLKEYDISSLNGSYYVSVSCAREGTSGTGTYTVYKVWLEA